MGPGTMGVLAVREAPGRLDVSSPMPTPEPENTPQDPFARLAELPTDQPCTLLVDCGVGRAGGLSDGRYGWASVGAPPGVATFGAMLFASPVDVLEISAAEVAGAEVFARIDAFLREHEDRVVTGALGYDLRDAVEPIERESEEDFEVPVVHLQAHDSMEAFPERPVSDPEGELGSAVTPAPVLSAEAYQDLVARTVESIRAGDIFQANLTQPFDGRFEGDPKRLFHELCHVSPAPFAAFVSTGTGTSILSSSPEEFLHRDGDVLRTRPIKGTRPRDEDPAVDERLRSELFESEKDRAELAMIVDLLRNDLGKVAEIGSVRWADFPEQASFAQVHHLFCTVTAQLRAGVTPAEILRATFPCGSITGAPKLRCMEILEKLEIVRRGFYTGAIGVFGPGPTMHLNVAIRTMTLRDGRVRFNVGGGVTADSDPVAEWRETWDKAAGMLRSFGAQSPIGGPRPGDGS